MIDLPRSTYYYRSTAKALNLGDSELIAIIEDIQDELPCYGYRRVIPTSADGDSWRVPKSSNF